MKTNGERFKESIRNCAIQHEYDFILELDNEFNFINESDDNYINSVVSFLDWQSAEFKEPIKLTKDEHNFLRHTNRQVFIENRTNDFSNNPMLHIDNVYVGFLNFKFNGLKNDRKYTVAEILRNCEVTD